MLGISDSAAVAVLSGTALGYAGLVPAYAVPALQSRPS